MQLSVKFIDNDDVMIYEPNSSVLSIKEPCHIGEDYDETPWYEEEEEDIPWWDMPDLDEDDELTTMCKLSQKVKEAEEAEQERVATKLQANVVRFALNWKNTTTSKKLSKETSNSKGGDKDFINEKKKAKINNNDSSADALTFIEKGKLGISNSKDQISSKIQANVSKLAFRWKNATNFKNMQNSLRQECINVDNEILSEIQKSTNNNNKKKSSTVKFFDENDVIIFEPEASVMSIKDPFHVGEAHDETPWYEEEEEDIPWWEMPDLDEEDELTTVCKQSSKVKDAERQSDKDRIATKIEANVAKFALSWKYATSFKQSIQSSLEQECLNTTKQNDINDSQSISKRDDIIKQDLIQEENNVNKRKKCATVKFNDNDDGILFEPDASVLSIKDPDHVGEEYDETPWYEEEEEDIPWWDMPDLDEDDELTTMCKLSHKVVQAEQAEQDRLANRLQANVARFALSWKYAVADSKSNTQNPLDQECMNVSNQSPCEEPQNENKNYFSLLQKNRNGANERNQTEDSKKLTKPLCNDEFENATKSSASISKVLQLKNMFNEAGNKLMTNVELGNYTLSNHIRHKKDSMILKTNKELRDDNNSNASSMSKFISRKLGESDSFKLKKSIELIDQKSNKRDSLTLNRNIEKLQNARDSLKRIQNNPREVNKRDSFFLKRSVELRDHKASSYINHNFDSLILNKNIEKLQNARDSLKRIQNEPREVNKSDSFFLKRSVELRDHKASNYISHKFNRRDSLTLKKNMELRNTQDLLTKFKNSLDVSDHSVMPNDSTTTKSAIVVIDEEPPSKLNRRDSFFLQRSVGLRENKASNCINRKISRRDSLTLKKSMELRNAKDSLRKMEKCFGADISDDSFTSSTSTVSTGSMISSNDEDTLPSSSMKNHIFVNQKFDSAFLEELEEEEEHDDSSSSESFHEVLSSNESDTKQPASNVPPSTVVLSRSVSLSASYPRSIEQNMISSPECHTKSRSVSRSVSCNVGTRRKYEPIQPQRRASSDCVPPSASSRRIPRRGSSGYVPRRTSSGSVSRLITMFEREDHNKAHPPVCVERITRNCPAA